MKNERANFGSKLGVILVSAGSAVGLGNVWRFPYEVGQHGGAAFIMIYILCVLLMGMPVMISEFVIGRRSHRDAMSAFSQLAPGSCWNIVGLMGVLSSFLILGYYSVVAGWTLEYVVEAGCDGFADKSVTDFQNAFAAFSQNLWRPIVWLTVIALLTHYIIVKGVQKGIERFSKLMMPLLFLLIIVLVGSSLSLSGAWEGVRFLLYPDFSKVDADVFLGAMGQAFFSMSIGLGILCTFGSYFGKDTNLGRTALHVSVIDSVVAVLAGLIIFPAAFSVGIRPDAGPSLVFITLPNVFQQAFGGMPLLSYIFSIAFYVLLALAALTSTVSLHEAVTACLHEKLDLSRTRAACMVTGGIIVLGILSSLSLGILNGYTLGGMNFFDLLDFITAKIMLPVSGLFISLFVGWKLKRSDVIDEVSNSGKLPVPFFPVCFFLLRYFVPIAIVLIFLNGLGIFAFLK